VELEALDEILKERQRVIKKRAIGNPSAAVVTHNKESKPRKIPEHIDPVAIEWTDVRKRPPFVIGEKVRPVSVFVLDVVEPNLKNF
jgi:hypothetical protein